MTRDNTQQRCQPRLSSPHYFVTIKCLSYVHIYISPSVHSKCITNKMRAFSRGVLTHVISVSASYLSCLCCHIFLTLEARWGWTQERPDEARWGQMRLNTGEGMTYTRLFVVNWAFVFNIMNFSAPEVTYNTTSTQIIIHSVTESTPRPGTTACKHLICWLTKYRPLIGCCRD